ncbi:MAG: hypothetical protein HYV63_01790 [Candidatus Schekmanbacteria bacterium]|nr:hypothetical protein [Candidatus Schekmanbacteria bacterium]
MLLLCPLLCPALLACSTPASAEDLIVDGVTQSIAVDTTIAGQVMVMNGGELIITNGATLRVSGPVFVETGGTLRIADATLVMDLEYDEQHWIDIAGGSRLVLANGVIRSADGRQYWIELHPEDGGQPSMEVSGAASWVTQHSGIRSFGAAQITVTDGNVEELQVRDQVTASVTSGGAAYVVLFFDGTTASLDPLDTGTGITNTLGVPGGWTLELVDAVVDGYQIDLANGADVSVANADGVVLSVHTPGDLGTELQVVSGVTSDGYASGVLDNLGSRFTWSDANIALLNVYLFGTDRVLLRNLHVNEANAQDRSELIIGALDATTWLNCNLCQVYDNATFTVENAIIDNRDNVPSATSSYADLVPAGQSHGVMSFRGMDLTELYLTAREHGTINLVDCTYDPTKIEKIDPTATINYVSSVPAVAGLSAAALLAFLARRFATRCRSRRPHTPVATGRPLRRPGGVASLSSRA